MTDLVFVPRDQRPPTYTATVKCGTSDPDWHNHPELKGRMCVLDANHEDFHIAHLFQFEEERLDVAA